MNWNTHSRSLGFADDHRTAFSIVLVGDQIADSAVEGPPLEMPFTARISTISVRSDPVRSTEAAVGKTRSLKRWLRFGEGLEFGGNVGRLSRADPLENLQRLPQSIFCLGCFANGQGTGLGTG